MGGYFMGMDPGPAGSEPPALIAARRVTRERELRARHRAAFERFEASYNAWMKAEAQGCTYELAVHFHECMEARAEAVEALALLKSEFGL